MLRLFSFYLGHICRHFYGNVWSYFNTFLGGSASFVSSDRPPLEVNTTGIMCLFRIRTECYLLTAHRFTLTGSQFVSNGKWHRSRCPSAHGQASGVSASTNWNRLIKRHGCVYCLCVEKPTRVNWALEELRWSVRTGERVETCPLERALRPPASFWSLSDLLWAAVS